MSSWSTLPAPPFPICMAQLLTDGRVMGFQFEDHGARGTCFLTPDARGSYSSGTWTTGEDMISPRLFFASHILSDGRVFVAGGEYPTFGDAAEVYDPVGNTWTELGQVGLREGDAPSCILDNGNVIIGDINNVQYRGFDGSAFYNVGNFVPPDESAWILLPTDEVLAAGFVSPNQLLGGTYDRGSNSWNTTANLPFNMVNVNGETGALCQLHEGRSFFVGGNGLNALYDPGAHAWSAAAGSPLDGGGVPLCGNDSPGAVLPNGKVLVALGPQPGGGGGYPAGFNLFLYDPGSNTFAPESLPDPSWAAFGTFMVTMLVLPSGQVLVVGSQAGSKLALYNPDGGPQDAWRPLVKSAQSSGATTFTLSGEQLCGLTQGAYYGDDWITATNHPVVYAVDQAGTVYFCRTSNISSRSIKPGVEQSCTVTLPPSLPQNAQVTFHVVANGVNSAGSGFGVGGIGVVPDGTQVRCNYVAWGW